MKYIRTTTPTNILKPTTSFIVDRTDVTCFKTHGNKGRYVNDTIETEENLEKWLKYNNTSIFKQADTIEELCDEFTIVYENCKPLVFDINEFMRYRDEYLKRKLIYGTEIYFSIWVGNDLHAVAKMNDKGELELL